jgi:hypothetical protein
MLRDSYPNVREGMDLLDQAERAWGVVGTNTCELS